MSGNMLVPIDFSDITDLVLEQAATLAKALDKKLWLIHVAAPEPAFIGYEVGPQYERDYAAERLRQEHQWLEGYQNRLKAQGLDATALLIPGQPAKAIVEEAEKLQVDLIVIGSHGHGALYDLLAGSVCESVLRRARCPVVVIPKRLLNKAL
jgi:nucleotide-binding universal stress UspA family protein